MIDLDYKKFKRLAGAGNIAAVVKTIPADLETPVSCFLKLAQNEPHAFLLESAEQEERIGRYSFIGLHPECVLTGRGRRVKISEADAPKGRWVDGHAVDWIEKLLATYRLANPEDVPGFSGGFVGYLGYENVEYFEDIRLRSKTGVDIPDSIFFLPRGLVVFDHFRKKLSLVVFSSIRDRKRLKSAYRQALSMLHRYTLTLRKPLKLGGRRSRKRTIRPVSNMPKAVFCRKVEKIKSYIRAGDCIQVVLSQRFRIPQAGNDFQIYRALRSVNPSPYMFYFKSGQYRLIGSSPECLVKKTGLEAEVRPIAGTRPRGKSAAEDAVFEANLKKSPKEMAEHVMLVDLGRNDLGRVCEFDSVRVRRYAQVERYSHVMHLVSDVAGRLKAGKTAFDLLKATFPAGTLSGAPKIRAMQIIDELEGERRGPYGGCLGYFGFNRDMDMCIVIRTLVLAGKKIYLQAGAGIVQDSSPEREYAETVNKAGALLKAIEMMEDF
jgi:anthranilate synthase component 1